MKRFSRFLIPLIIFFAGLIPIAYGFVPEETAFAWQTFANAYDYGDGIDAGQ